MGTARRFTLYSRGGGLPLAACAGDSRGWRYNHGRGGAIEGRRARIETTFREAAKEDLAGCLEVFEESLTDMSARHNHPPPGPVNPFRVAVHEHIRKTGIFHLAEQAGRAVAFACAIVREHNWFLAGFWARPSVQGQGIGIKLLRSVWEAGRQAGARAWFVLASSDPPALSSYMKMGMLPGCQILQFAGEPKLRTSVPKEYSTEPLETAQAARLDAAMRGGRREEDQDFMRAAGWEGMQVRQGRKVVGYYSFRNEALGPAAWSEARHAEAVLTLACRDRGDVHVDVPGMNHDALRFAFGSGLRLSGHSHLLWTSPVGKMERYIPSGAYLF